jgi:hypothetical protein
MLKANCAPGAAEYAEAAAETSIANDDTCRCASQRIDRADVLWNEFTPAAFVVGVARAGRLGAPETCGFDTSRGGAILATFTESPEDELRARGR